MYVFRTHAVKLVKFTSLGCWTE